MAYQMRFFFENTPVETPFKFTKQEVQLGSYKDDKSNGDKADRV